MFFFFNDTATTEIYTLSLHDALPIWAAEAEERATWSWCWLLPADPEPRHSHRHSTGRPDPRPRAWSRPVSPRRPRPPRSEEHTSELQSRQYLVCRLLLEKKKKKTTLI